MGLAAGAAGLATAIGGGLAAAAPAIGGLTGLIGAGTSIAGALSGGNTAKQTEGQVNQLYQPYATAGAGALNQINTLLSPGQDVMPALESQPGYQAGFDQGQVGLDRAESAAGTLNSGGTQKAAIRTGQDYATSTYQNILNNLYKVAGMGAATIPGQADNIASGNSSQAAATNQAIGAGGQLLNGLLNPGAPAPGSVPVGAQPNMAPGQYIPASTPQIGALNTNISTPVF